MDKKHPLRQMLSSTKAKIFILFVLFNVFSVCLSDFILYRSSTRILFGQACDILANNLYTVAFSLDSALDSINTGISDIALDSSVSEDIQKDFSPNSYEYLLFNDRMRLLLNDTQSISRLLQSVYLVSADYDYFCKSLINRTYTRQELMQSDWSRFYPISTDSEWYVIPGDHNAMETTTQPTLTMVKRIYNSGYNRIVGYVSANIGFEELRNYLEQYQFAQTGYLMVCIRDGTILYHPDRNLCGQKYDGIDRISSASPKDSMFVEDDVLVAYRTTGRNGLVYAACVPIREIIIPADTLQKTLLLLIALALLFSLIYAGLISNRIYAPIKVLVKHMKQAAGGDTSVRIRDVRHDEMGILYENFNDMICQIEHLIQKLYEQEFMTKNLQIKNLQIQLNPHFLYNVLDSIHWAARENDMDDVCQMTFLLSRYFQKNLDNGRDWSTIEDIAAAMTAYMELQRIRYENKLMYEISVDPSISKCKVPKYLFQPLLENAVLHGIEKRSSTGICRVTWSRVENRIHFSVQDNGIGIEAEKLAHIRASIEKSDVESTEHFAFRNINAQLRLLYGESYHLVIHSTPGLGTTVEFDLPLSKEDVHV